jgi:hypothetical protein
MVFVNAYDHPQMERVAITTDIHGNLPALEATLAAEAVR